MAASADVKAAAMPSPIVAKTSPPTSLHRGAQHGEVLLDAVVHLGRLLPLPGRALDVGEQERPRHGCGPAAVPRSLHGLTLESDYK